MRPGSFIELAETWCYQSMSRLSEDQAATSTRLRTQSLSLMRAMRVLTVPSEMTEAAAFQGLVVGEQGRQGHGWPRAGDGQAGPGRPAGTGIKQPGMSVRGPLLSVPAPTVEVGQWAEEVPCVR
jgi:hypothetical protein